MRFEIRNRPRFLPGVTVGPPRVRIAARLFAVLFSSASAPPPPHPRYDVIRHTRPRGFLDARVIRASRRLELKTPIEDLTHVCDVYKLRTGSRASNECTRLRQWRRVVASFDITSRR